VRRKEKKRGGKKEGEMARERMVKREESGRVMVEGRTGSGKRRGMWARKEWERG
jgi:Tfp pilus assembly pilus retraction ATPase PilT